MNLSQMKPLCDAMAFLLLMDFLYTNILQLQKVVVNNDPKWSKSTCILVIYFNAMPLSTCIDNSNNAVYLK